MAERGPEEVDRVVRLLAGDFGMNPQVVQMLWFSVVRQARPTAAPGTIAPYVALAKEHHNIAVEVVDLGQYSAEHHNSCIFLTCAASLADRRIKGCADADLPGVLGEALAAAFGAKSTVSIQDLVAEHTRCRVSSLGRMADALRHAACEVLLHDEAFYLPFFHPTGSLAGEADEPSSEKFVSWVEGMRGDEEGDELVVLALARLCGLAVQPVQACGYRVPTMDPTSSADSGSIVYWGNDDKHWVWLRPTEG